MERLVYTKVSLLVNSNRNDFEQKVYEFMSLFNFDEMYSDEDDELIFYSKVRPFSIREFQDGTKTKIQWQLLQEKWLDILDEQEAIKDDFRKCFDVAQSLDSMYPEMPGAFTGTVSERLYRHLERIQTERISKDVYSQK